MSGSSAKQDGGATAPPPDWAELDKKEDDQLFLDEFVRRVTSGEADLLKKHQDLIHEQKAPVNVMEAITRMRAQFKPEAYEALIQPCPVCGASPPPLPMIEGVCRACAAKVVIDFKKAREEANSRDAKKKAADALIKEYDDA